MSDDDHIITIVDDKVRKLDGYYLLQITEKGIYLTVHSPQNAGVPVQESVIMQDLASRGISNFFPGMIAKVITEATGDAMKIAEAPVIESEPEISVLVSRDRMESTLTIKKPPQCRQLLIDEVLATIHKAGIVFGIDRAVIEQAMEKPGCHVVCAKGTAVHDGKSATIKLFFDKNVQARPVEREDGTVDFKNLQMFTTVKKGELLAEKVPATAGIPGMDVLGHECIPKHGKDCLFPVGKNVHVEDNKVLASIAGQVVYNNNKIHVMPVIKIDGDVDISTGNIDFIGSVIVSGSVQAGFTVKAGGDLEIAGTLCGGMIEAKNILVRMGIQGMHRGYIKAVENVVAKFIENATVFAGNEVIISDVILHSKVSAGKKVIVEGRRGLIAGGSISAGEEIRAKNAGTRMAIATDLEVGVNPVLREENRNLIREIDKVHISLEQAKKALIILRAMNADTMSSDKKEMMLKLTKAQFHLMGQESTMKERAAAIAVMLDEMRYGRIKISEEVFPGVKIVVGTIVKPIRESMKFVAFFEENGEVKVGSFR
jgi:uncharacterized protein (DUF342 family)